jgi:hypothetical protein
MNDDLPRTIIYDCHSDIQQHLILIRTRIAGIKFAKGPSVAGRENLQVKPLNEIIPLNSNLCK